MWISIEEWMGSGWINAVTRLRRHPPFQRRGMKNLFIAVVLWSIPISGISWAATWQETLEQHFDIVETFDQLQNWKGTVSSASDYDAGHMPKLIDGGNSIWTFYSNWTGTPTGNWIGPHPGYEWQSGSPNNLKMSYGEPSGPSRLGLYFGDENDPHPEQTGYADLYLFYMVYVPANAYPTATGGGGNGTWSYSTGGQYAYVGYYKFNTTNKGCFVKYGACGLFEDGRNYSTYHIIPQLEVMGSWGGNGSGFSTRLQTTDDGSYTFFEPGALYLPTDEWFGVEFHFKNEQNGAATRVTIEAWYYDRDGLAHTLIPQNTDSDDSQPYTDKWNSFFFGGNISGSPDGTMDTVHYIDDFIIDGNRIGPLYFQILSGTVPPNPHPQPPAFLRIKEIK